MLMALKTPIHKLITNLVLLIVMPTHQQVVSFNYTAIVDITTIMNLEQLLPSFIVIMAIGIYFIITAITTAIIITVTFFVIINSIAFIIKMKNQQVIIIKAAAIVIMVTTTANHLFYQELITY